VNQDFYNPTDVFMTSWPTRPAANENTGNWCGGVPIQDAGVVTPGEFNNSNRGYNIEEPLVKVDNTQPSIALNYIIKF